MNSWAKAWGLSWGASWGGYKEDRPSGGGRGVALLARPKKATQRQSDESPLQVVALETQEAQALIAEFSARLAIERARQSSELAAVDFAAQVAQADYELAVLKAKANLQAKADQQMIELADREAMAKSNSNRAAILSSLLIFK